MTADTRPVAQEAALDRLREVLRPGDRVYALERMSRSGDTKAVRLFAVCERRLRRLHGDVADALRVALLPQDEALILAGDSALTDLIDRLSIALFGEPGQIKGECL